MKEFKLKRYGREKANIDTNEDFLYQVDDGESDEETNDSNINNLSDEWDFIPPPELDYTFEEDPEETERLLQEFLRARDVDMHIGHVSEQEFTEFKNSSSKIPFSRYPHMGPGNEIYPVAFNEIDEIARIHDTDYSNAKTVYDVQHADDEFIRKMSAVKPEDVGAWVGKQVGLGGISIKYMVERKLGLIYPMIRKEPEKYNINPQDFQTLQIKIGPAKLTPQAKSFLTGLRDFLYPKKYTGQDEVVGPNAGVDALSHEHVVRLHESYRDANAKINKQQIDYIFMEFEKDAQEYYNKLLTQYLYSTDEKLREHIKHRLSYFDDDLESYFMKWTDNVPFDKENKQNILYRAYFSLSSKEELRYKALAHKIKYQVLNKYNEINKLHKFLAIATTERSPDLVIENLVISDKSKYIYIR